MTSTLLSRGQTIFARKLRMYVLLRPVIVQNELDGGAEIPAGRAIYIPPRGTPRVPEAYVPADDLLIAAPDVYDARIFSVAGIQSISRKQVPYFVVVPQGKELEWLHILAAKSNLSVPV